MEIDAGLLCELVCVVAVPWEVLVCLFFSVYSLLFFIWLVGLVSPGR